MANRMNPKTFFGELKRRNVYKSAVAYAVASWLLIQIELAGDTYTDRNNFEGWKPNDWIGAELMGLPLGICAVLAGWGKPCWLQWIGVGGMFVQNVWSFGF